MYKLLLVDDEPIIIKGIRSFVDFEALSISEVYEAYNGEDALESFKKYLPDLVLADINMPKINGLDFANAAKAMKPDVKIAIITGYDYFDYAVTALKSGLDDYVLKPVSKNDIQEVLKKLIEKLQTAHNQLEISQLVHDMISIPHTSEDAGYKAKIQQEIEANIANVDFSLTFLAKKMSLSSTYLSSLFKRLYGKTFQDYMLSTRLDRAKILLLSTDLKIYEIATAVGFEDPNYFSTSFKRKFKFSPNRFKERARE
ncbi:response regulator transcription factor [Neobacillus kokaensis]|uniref:DNA-binding response regulator n=1 Tax=Neobacillus kokaensis TaxID=2759023 RepID=A0ABQ3N0I4_9BACI|nr:response regulator [Neobacillus kokaensis]GHH98079.1 DNA-binding response regulator [Neobacillus kokaensis]